MNTKQMHYLIETAKTLNLSRAAENLFISQPSLSYQIKVIEEEVGFSIFERMGKSIRLTPAGENLIVSLESIRRDLQFAIEQAQNLGDCYSDSIKIGLPSRTFLYYLPEAIKAFGKSHPNIFIFPEFQTLDHNMRAFMNQELDVLLLPREEAEKLRNCRIFPLYKSHIYLLCLLEDPLAKKALVKKEDLKNRTLLVNGGSSTTLRQVQQKVISSVRVNQINSPNHDFTLVQVASKRAICLSPGYLNDHSGQFAWVPFDCPEFFDYVMVFRENAKANLVTQFLDLLKDFYVHSELNL